MKVYVAVGEGKNDRGVGGCDGTVQCSFLAKRLWCQDNVRTYREKTCCPTFLLSFDGPWLAIQGGIFTDKWVTQRLAECYVGRNTCLEDGSCDQAARVLYALRVCLKDMVSWYSERNSVQGLDLRGQPNLHPRWYPQPTTYPAPRDGTPGHHGMSMVRFRYLLALKSGHQCTIFLASLSKTRFVIVKFIERYGEMVHRALAKAGYAPALLYCGALYPEDPVAKRYKRTLMVVMEVVTGPSVEDLAQEGRRLTPDQHAQLRAAVDCMHEHGFVHGDLRKPNVMVTSAGKIQLIDFDWAGENEQVRYPVHLRSGAFCPGVETDAPISQAHDNAMLDMHFG
ncbi:hypothetical protein FA95DRAFT_1498071 [Auriscalpium vulgare]|uniref:Uncharacterized protein n=1 Tax=Auriscalpium vulgare TaxID=40419 RepID=A0ACB8RI28_9AGAM|nr:hypothetical protein FA95DRAFT_1498071 [Auriscalpium vulgare]